MFRQASIVALNDIAVACREAADFYRDGSNQAGKGGLSDVFVSLAQDREQKAETLDGHIQTLSELPQTPDTDKLQIQKIIQRIRASFADDERLALIDERLHAEHRIDSLTVIAARHELPEDTEAFLKTLRESVQAAQRRLSGLKGKL